MDNLFKVNKVNPILHSEIISFLKICLDQNYFEINNKIYLNDKGLIMGNPLSKPLTSGNFHRCSKIIHNHPISKSFIYRYRYLDDIICCFNGTERQF